MSCGYFIIMLTSLSINIYFNYKINKLETTNKIYKNLLIKLINDSNKFDQDIIQLKKNINYSNK